MSNKNKELNLATDVLNQDSVMDLNTESDSKEEASIKTKGLEAFVTRLKHMKNKELRPSIFEGYKNIY